LWIINLFGEKQTWPAFPHLAAKAKVTAEFTSPSSSTTKGSFPPNYITAFLRCFPAFSAIKDPPLDDPVKLTPPTDNLSNIWSIWL